MIELIPFFSKSWSIPVDDENLCPWIVSDRLPYPIGGTTPVIGRLIYENSVENSSAFQMYSFASTILVLQGLTNGTLKLVSVRTKEKCLKIFSIIIHLCFDDNEN